MRKSLSLLIALALVLAFCICAHAESAYKPGTYTASAQGFGGTVTVTIEIGDEGILSVVCEGENETSGIGGEAMPKLADAVLEAQGADIDGITGATLTSGAVISAVNECLAEAMGETVEIPAVKMLPGTYTGYGWGFSQVRQVPVTVVVDETNILSAEVDVEGAAETTHLMSAAINLMIPRIIEHNSLAVDATTGATASATAVKTAIADCVAQALAAAGTPAEAIENFYTPLEYPEKEPEVIDVDIVVVGMGGTGTAASMRAAEAQVAAGREVSVLTLEKAGTYGGTSSATTSLLGFNSQEAEKYVGEEYAAAVDLRANHRDSAGEVVTDTFYLDPQVIRDYVTDIGILGVGNVYAENYWDHVLNESGQIVDWLVSHGFYFGQPRVGFSSDWHTQFYYCDGKGEANLQKVHDCFDKMVADFTALGGRYMTETEGYELLYDKDENRVTGVKAHSLVDGTEYIINAKAVILATGGFGGNSEMMKKYNGGDYWLYGMAQNDGKMIQSAIDIGAGTLGMNSSMQGSVHNISSKPMLHVFDYNFDESGKIDIWRDDIACWSLNDVPNIIVASHDCMWVSQDGTRKVNEAAQWAWPDAGDHYFAVVNQDWIDNVRENGFAENHVELFCNAGFVTFPLNTPIPEMDDVLAACEEAGIMYKADTIAELAEKLDMDAAVLEATYADYNKYCAEGEDPLGKGAADLKSIEGGTLYAFRGAARPYHSVGGLDVTKNNEVVLADGGAVINGLYAGGTDCMGASAPAFGGGLQLWAYMSGAIAAESAVEYIQK